MNCHSTPLNPIISKHLTNGRLAIAITIAFAIAKTIAFAIAKTITKEEK
jgi:hypothetical protein